MQKIPEYNDLSHSDARREFRRSMEGSAARKDLDQIQLNDIMLGALVIIAAIISFTDFSFSIGNLANFTAITVFLYIVTMFVYRNRYASGITRGKRDSEYIRSLSEYREKRNGIYDRGLAGKVPSFCTYYKKKELKEYREELLCDIEMEYEVYQSKYLHMRTKEILRLPLSLDTKRTLIKCNRAKPIRLNAGMILNENGEYDRNNLIGKSGRQRERSDKKRQAISRAVYVVFGALVAFDVIFNFSLSTMVQWIVRMLPIVIATISGDDGGYCNITVTELRFKGDQIHAIGLFNEYVRDEKVIDE